MNRIQLTNRILLCELFYIFYTKPHNFKDYSKMSPQNLAIVIAPNILRPKVENTMTVMADQDSKLRVVTWMIETTYKLYPQIDTLKTSLTSNQNNQKVDTNNIGSGLTSHHSGGLPKAFNPPPSLPGVQLGSGGLPKAGKRPNSPMGMAPPPMLSHSKQPGVGLPKNRHPRQPPAKNIEEPNSDDELEVVNHHPSYSGPSHITGVPYKQNRSGPLGGPPPPPTLPKQAGSAKVSHGLPRAQSPHANVKSHSSSEIPMVTADSPELPHLDIPPKGENIPTVFYRNLNISIIMPGGMPRVHQGMLQKKLVPELESGGRENNVIVVNVVIV
eukprot:UN30979